jgi:hypothetical protein
MKCDQPPHDRPRCARVRELLHCYAQVTRYTEGTLIVDFVDAKTATSIWRGTATGTIGSAQSNQQKIQEAIRKMLESIPPRG